MTWVLDTLDLIWSLTLDHIRQSVIAIALGFVIALPIGWAAWRYTILRGPVLTTIGLLYTIPSLGLFALLAALGVPYLSETNLIIALTIYGVAIMTRSVADGLDSVDARRWMSATLVNLVDPEVPESLKPLIDGGTEGALVFLGTDVFLDML